MSNKKSKSKSENVISSSIIAPGIVVLIVLIVIVAIFYKNRKYKITVNGTEYICSSRNKIKNEDNMELFVSISKEKYSTLEEARQACIQDEIAIYSSTGQLEEYQERMTDCEFKNEDDEVYNFYQEPVYHYTQCQEVK